MALDIFSLLKAIDKFDLSYYDKLSEQEKKEIYFFLVQRWMSGTKDKKQIIYLNSFSNNKVWNLYKEPKILYMLMCACSTGSKKYSYPKRKKKENKSEVINAIIQYYNCSLKNAIDYAKILSSDDIL